MKWPLRPIAVTCLVSACLVLLVAAGCSKDPEYAKQQYLESGDRFFEQEKYREAIVQYRNALQQDQKFGAARLKLAEALERVGDVPAALREWVRAADARPDDVQTQVKAGMYLLAARQFEDARARAEQALAKDASNVEAQILLGNALAGLKDFDAAVKELEEAVELDPGSAPALTSLGAAQLLKGSRPDAEASFRKAVNANPELPGVHMALANFLMQAGRAAEAEASLKKALELDQTNALAHRALAAFYVFTRRAAEAEPHMKALADMDTSPAAQRKLALADYYVGLHRIEDANKVLEGLTGEKGSFGAARTRQAVIAYGQQDREAGNRAIDEVLEREPRNVAALLAKSRFLAAEGKVDEALQRARAAVAAEPRSIIAHFLVGSLLRTKNDREGAIAAFSEVIRLNPRAVAAQVQLAQLNLQGGNRSAALQFAQDASSGSPSDPNVRLTLARSLLATGQVPQAEREVRAILQTYPNAPAAHIVLGSVLIARQDFAGARTAFTRAYELDENSFEALSGLLAADFAQKKPDDARARVEEQLARTPDDSRMLMLAAQVYMGTGDAPKGEELLRASLERNPGNLHAYGVLGRLYASQKRLPEARTAFEKLIEQQPESVAAHTMVAMLLDSEGRRDEARARYERTLQVDPTAAVAANNLAYIYAEDGGNLDVALQLAQTAKQRLPEVHEISHTLGWIYYKKDLASLAVPHFEDALRRDPKNATYQLHLGMAQLKLGEVTKARQALEQVVHAAPESREGTEAKKLLSSMM